MAGDDGAATATVVVGRYALEVGAPAGTAISLVAEGTAADGDLPLLTQALEEDEREEPGGAVGGLEDAVEGASQVTDRVEQANGLFRALTEGSVLDPANLSGEIDRLLELLGRLDRAGRFEEALRLGRALSRVLALTMRWIELVRSLRTVLRAARQLDDLQTAGWALHELGTLHVSAERVRSAERRLHEARSIREQIGDRRGLAATERNLGVLCHQLRDLLRQGKLHGKARRALWPRPVAPVIGAAILLLGIGGVAGAVVDGGSGDDGAQTDTQRAGLSIAIRAPAEGAQYRTRERVIADYTCAAARGAPAVRSCEGSVPDGKGIDTGKGAHTFTVTARDEDGGETRKSVAYTVSDVATPDSRRPQIRIAAPTAGIVGAERRPRADYSCQDEPGGSGVVSCEGTVRDGRPFDVDPGTHTFTVVAADAAGNRAEKTVTYTVHTDVVEGGECENRVDDDQDGHVDSADLGCADGSELPFDKTELVQDCADGIDNDGDGFTDKDPGCDDGTEAPFNEPPQVQGLPKQPPG